MSNALLRYRLAFSHMTYRLERCKRTDRFCLVGRPKEKASCIGPFSHRLFGNMQQVGPGYKGLAFMMRYGLNELFRLLNQPCWRHGSSAEAEMYTSCR